MRKWGEDGTYAPMPWEVAEVADGKILLQAESAVEMRKFDKHFCNWLNSELFNDMFFDGSANTVIPLDDSRIYTALNTSGKFSPKVEYEDAKLFCLEENNKVFLMHNGSYSEDLGLRDGLYAPYISARYKKMEDSTGYDCWRANGFPSPQRFVDSIIAVYPSIFVDTLLLQQY